jgi:hypothetical protein
VTKDLPEIALCKINGNKLTNIKILKSPGGEKNRCEKNWMPYCTNENINVIYEHSPMTIVKGIQNDTIEGQESQNSSNIIKLNTKSELKSFRGSAGPIKFEKGYLSIIHEVMFHDKKRVYINRFVYYNKHMIPEKMTYAFYFNFKSTEFVCGICMNHDEESVVLGLGTEDCLACLAIVPIDDINTALHPILC